ncbi:MAG: hypothetical protein ACPGGK_14740 [Pikeienuella sp.]
MEYDLEDVDAGLGRPLQRKYIKRPRNIRRAWNRLELLLPELMHDNVSMKKVLEMSTAHGAVLEILRHFGHDVVGNDFANMLSANDGTVSSIFRPVNYTDDKRTTDDYGNAIKLENPQDVVWPYKNIIDSIDIPMRIFDAGQTPYPAEDKEFDVTICLQALEHYCHPKDWMVIVEEFCRITKGSIVIFLNPPVRAALKDEGNYMEYFNRARLALRKYNANGFSCVHTSIWFGQALGFKLMAD